MLKRGLVQGQRLRLADIGYDIAISSVRFLGRHYLLYRETGEDGLTSICDYVGYEAEVAVGSGEDGSMLPVAKYGSAKPEEYLGVANLSAQTLADACMSAGYNEANREVSNNIGLALLDRYDKEGDLGDIDAAATIFEWLCCDSNEDRALIYEVNLLQTQCRRGELDPEAQARARDIIAEDASEIPSRREVTAVCWAILGDERKSASAFRKLNKEARGRLEGSPAGNLIRGVARRTPGK